MGPDPNIDVGHTIAGVWRPGLYYTEEILQGLAGSNVELRLAEQALLLLVQRLDELLHFVEPAPNTLSTYSHKARELLILACTEVENYWKQYLQQAGETPHRNEFTTNDYVKLKVPLFLDEIEVSLPRYPAVPPFRPFLDWSNKPSPTKTLPWYDAYNKTKHDRKAHFSEATLLNCLHAVAANIALFSVRFGPFYLFHGAGTLAAHLNQLISIELKDPNPKSFYAPNIILPPNQRNDLICFDARRLVQPRIVDSFRL